MERLILLLKSTVGRLLRVKGTFPQIFKEFGVIAR